jgi:signal transduction histidine kinase/CheY-like chemotaxis protein
MTGSPGMRAHHRAAPWLEPVILCMPVVAAVALRLEAPLRAPVITAISLAALVGCVVAFLRRARRMPREARGWRWLAASFGCYAVIYATYLARMTVTSAGWPRAIELLMVPSAVCQVVAMLSWPGAPAHIHERARAALDGITFALATLCMQWLLGVAALTRVEGVPAATRWMGVLPFLTVSIAMGVIVAVAARYPPLYRGVLGVMLLAAVLGAADNLATLALALDGRYHFGDPIDVIGLVAFALAAAAARWAPALREETAPPWLERLSQVVPYVPGVALVVLLLQQHATDRVHPRIADALWLVYPLIGLILLRQVMTLADLRLLSSTLEAQVQERTRALAAARDELLRERRLEALGRLAGGVAHDFNNLLTGIGGHAHLIALGEPRGSEVAGFADEIMRAVERGAGLTRQILTFARRQPGEARVIAPAQVVKDLQRLLGRLVGDDVTLTVSGDERAGHVYMDPGQLEQVVVNLVVNARDAMPRGGHIDIAVAAADVAAGEAARHHATPGHYVTITVADTGEGMSAETRARLFEPFYTTKSAGQGTGLGLATSHGIVRQGGGFFTVESELGRGSRFVVHLPATDRPAVAHAPVAPMPAPEPPGRRVLLVDDSPALREALGDALRASGFDVVCAGDGGEALAMANRRGHPIDVLVTDVAMPGMSGIDVARAVTDAHPEVRVILISGYHELSEEAVPTGVTFLAKPFLTDELVRKIGEVVRPS